MEKKKYELCLEILKRFQEHGILDNIILVGSWCVYIYKDYFKDNEFLPAIRTRDIEFLIPIPPKFEHK